MLAIQRRVLWFTTKEIYFSDAPVDIDGCSHVEFHYCTKDESYEGFHQTVEYSLEIDLSDTEETLFSQMKKNTRNHIRGAKNQGVIITQSNDFIPFYTMYTTLFKQKGLTSLGNRFGIGKLIPRSVLERYGTLFYAHYNGDIIVGDIYLEGTDSVFSWAGASPRLHVDKTLQKVISRAERLCVWHAMQYYKSHGKRLFDLGGMWPEQEAKNSPMKKGINSYKKGFGGTIVKRYAYQKTYSPLYRLFSNTHTRLIS